MQQPARRPASPADLRAEARHADQRVALYRRRVLLGRGDPRRLAELERVAAGAADRLRATARSPDARPGTERDER